METFNVLTTLGPVALAVTAVTTGAIALGLGAGYLPKLAANIGVKVFSMFVKK
jgi:hypothetical protein